MLKILRYYNRYLVWILAIFVLLYIQVMTDLALPDYMSKIVNDGIVKGDNAIIGSTGLSMILVSLLGAACSILVAFLSSWVASGISRNLRSDIFKKVESFNNAEFDKFSTASLITRSTNDIQQVQLVSVMILRILFQAPIMGIGGIIKAFDKNRSMTWIIAIAVAALLLLIGILFLVALPRFKRIQKIIDKVNLVMRERLSGMLVIRAFNTQKHEQERFDGVNRELTDVNLFVNRAMSLMMPMMMLIMNGTSIGIVWIGAGYINAGDMQIGDMMAFMQYAMQIIMSFLMVSMMFIMIPRASVSAVRIDEVLKTKPTIVDPSSPKEFKKGLKGTVEFIDVSFKYPDADEYVLKDITFTAKPGQTTAFIGSTGSGKSTLINLIPRFYDVTEGEIRIDGVNVKDVSQHSLREKIGYVPQKGLLFSGTIGTNIAFSDEKMDKDRIDKAADIAQAMEFINAKEEKFESSIAQGGTNVSGGQKQRLSIARALAKKPEVYIFDDSFSALDFKTDAILREKLKGYTTDAAVLIVAQRINTIQNADQIIVLDDGGMAGIGTHKELLVTCPIYKEIALSQLSKEELE